MNTNIDSVNNGRLKPSNKRNPCPICNSDSGHCKYNPLKSLFLCHNFDVDVPGYKFIKKTKDSHWSIFVPESDFKGVPDSAILAEREERRLEREWLRKQQQALSLSDTDRHIEYTKLKDQLYLTVRDKTDLLKRGLTDEQIKKEGFVSVKQFQKLREYINPNLAGVNAAGKGLTNFCEGLLCFTKNPKGEITGYQIRLFLNLRRDIEAVSSEEYQAKLREAIDNYTANSIHFDMSSKLKWKSDFEVKKLRDCLMIMLKEAGHKISFEEVANDKVIKSEAKEIKEEITQEEITGIFNAEDITDSKGEIWDNNSQGLTKEERYQHKKWKYKQLLPGLASTSHWTIELIELLVKKPETISQLTLRYYFNNPDKVKQLKEFKLLKRLEYERIIFLKTAPSDYQKIEFLKKSGIEFLITDNSDFYCADTDWVTIVYGCLKSKVSTAERLGFKPSGNDKLKTINSILKKMGYRVERTQTHMDGKRVIGYRILPLDDLSQAMMNAIERRIDERIEKAIQSQSEDKPIDYAKFRRNDEPLSESSRDFEPDALVSVLFIKKQVVRSASANPPIGTWIELDLPMDFYFINSLVFDKVNGKRWQIVDYTDIRGEDYVYLENDSGEKSSIPCSWLAYCCDCIG